MMRLPKISQWKNPLTRMECWLLTVLAALFSAAFLAFDVVGVGRLLWVFAVWMLCVALRAEQRAVTRFGADHGA